MQMRRSLVVLTVASIVAIAALTLVSVGLSHAQAMRENVGFMGSSMHRMGQNDQTDCDESVSTHMNATQRMHGNMYDECDDMHDRMNMTRHMGDMR